MKLGKLAKKTYHMPIMKSYERKFIHELAGYYGFETTSHDQEPNRSVSLYANKDKIFLPIPLLMQSIEIKPKMSTMSRLTNIKQLTSDSNLVKSNLKVLEPVGVSDGNFLPLSSTYSVLAEQNSEKIDSSAFMNKNIKSEIDYFDFE